MVGVGVGDHHGVDVADQLAVVGHPPVDAPQVADAVEHGRADVAQRGHLEAVRELRQRGEVEDLRGLAATDDPDPDPLHAARG
jgi:hypothetical protein